MKPQCDCGRDGLGRHTRNTMCERAADRRIRGATRAADRRIRNELVNAYMRGWRAGAKGEILDVDEAKHGRSFAMGYTAGTLAANEAIAIAADYADHVIAEVLA